MTREEFAAVLCGLRLLQSEIEKRGEPLEQFMDIFTCGGELTPLTVEQIDKLCMRLNTSPKENDNLRISPDDPERRH